MSQDDENYCKMFLRALAFRQYLKLDRGRPHSVDAVEKVKKSSNESFLLISINLKIQQLIMYELIFCLKFLCFEYFGCLL